MPQTLNCYFDEEKAQPYMRTQYPTIKAPPRHGHIGCAVLNAALLPEEVYVMPICKLAQEEILGSRTRRCGCGGKVIWLTKETHK